MGDWAASTAFDKAMKALAIGDHRAARRLMKMAAQAHCRPAIHGYATFIEYGIGGHPSQTKAMTWYAKAAHLGDAPSSIWLGQWHMNKNQIPQAKYWLTKAAGHPQALLISAGLFEKSRAARAARNGHSALRSLGGRRSALTPLEDAEYQRLSKLLQGRSIDPPWLKNPNVKLKRKSI